METVILIGVLLLLALLITPFIAMASASGARREVANVEQRLREELRIVNERLSRAFERLAELEAGGRPSMPVQKPLVPKVAEPGPIVIAASELAAVPSVPPAPAAQAAPRPLVAPPVPLMPPPLPPRPAPLPTPPSSPTPAGPPPVPPLPAKPLNMEQFLGTKLFAWVGGLALFLGVIFFVKYAFERNLISPELRIAIGFLTGMGLLVAGAVTHRRKAYQVMGQTLCATGVLVLYGVTFASHALYHFAAFNDATTFGVMSLVTVVAFLLAVRMNAQVVAVLGMVGGFLTPILCSTGQDNPLGLFGYIALLDVGLLAVARRQRWGHLTALAVAGTALLQDGWLQRFGFGEPYVTGSGPWIIIAVYVGFAALFAAGVFWLRARDQDNVWPAWSALGLCAVSLSATFALLDHHMVLKHRPELLYSLVLPVYGCGLWAAWLQPRAKAGAGVMTCLTFLHLLAWTAFHLSATSLPAALVIYLIFGLMQTAFGVLWQRRHPGQALGVAQWMLLLVLILGLLPVLVLHQVSFIVWPALLATNLLMIGLALATKRVLPVLAAVVLTLLGAAAWLLGLTSPAAGSLDEFLIVVAGFALVFIGAGCYLAHRSLAGADKPEPFAASLPVVSAVLPFGLLMMAAVQLPVLNPAPLFGVGLLLCLFLLGLVKISRVHALSLAAVLCILGLEYVWHAAHFNRAEPVQPLLWYLGFQALFMIFPFAFRKALEQARLPWIAAAVANIATFALVHDVIHLVWPNPMMGLVPAAFALPALLSLIGVLRLHGADNPARLSQLAWYGGTALLFITLIFPIQFDRQWLTIGWAMEGAALVWLFRRVPHKGLYYTGAALLIGAFARLALNPAVLTYATRGSVPVWNWFLYAYGLVALAQFVAAGLMRRPGGQPAGSDWSGILTALGGVLLFLLMNIEIADAFTPAGGRFVTFDFAGNLARDMSYSIGWGLFALALLVLGFWKHSKPSRYAGIGLLVVTLLKLFFHDLASIDSIYRIGALMAVAIIALAASFLYQRHFNDDKAGKV